MRNIKLTIEYDGTNYCGWQVQPNGITVQEVLKRAIENMTGHEVKLTGASRTDAGVHALGQVANFKTASKIPAYGFQKGLNSLLPKDIAIVDCKEAGEEFHAKNSAKGKKYRYLLFFGKHRPALSRNRVWHIRGITKKEIFPLIKKGGKTVVGTFDFSSFCAAGDCNKVKIRKIERITVVDTFGPDILAIEIVGTGFLKYMVRNIVGTLVSLSIKHKKGSVVAKEMKRILRSQDRKTAGVTAPADGLYLVEVYY